MLLTCLICLLVPDDQAQSILDQADFKQLEDWETPPRQNAIELKPILTNSEVFIDHPWDLL